MIPREHALKFLVTTALLSVAQSQNSRTYDTSDWIPLTNKCPTCYENEQKEHVIEKKATGRVLNLAEPNPNKSSFFPEEQSIRSKKASKENEQYLREVSHPAKRLPKRQHQPLDLRAIPTEIRQQLNQGEFVNQQYFRQPQFQNPAPVREYQKHIQQLPQQIQLTNQPQLLPPQLVVPQGQQYFAGDQQFAPQPLLNVPLLQTPEGLQLYQQNYQNVPIAPQQLQQPQPPNKHKTYELLNPGIINQGLSADTLASSNNNYKDLRQISITSTTPKPEAEKETVQLVYVPLESLNQRQPQLQKHQEQELQNQREAAFQQEQQLKADEEQQAKFQQAQQLKAQEEQQFKALREQQLKAIQEQQLKAAQEQQQQDEQEEQRKAQQLKAQQEKTLREQQEQQAVILQSQQPVPQVQLIQESPRRRIKPQRPTPRPQYQTRFSSIQNETPLEHRQQQLQSIQSDFAQQALDALRLQLQFQQGQTPEALPQVSTTTLRPTTVQPTYLPTPKKRKPHQPPLAVYMGADGEVTVTDVLNLLKNAKTISVQDTVGPNSPQVFVGPHNLEPPEGYTKFELPYLSALETNRVERKVEQLPFFVAPLSYKAPDGYSKIPLPAPHVGSVVVSQKNDELDKREQPPFRLENLLNEDPFRLPNQPTYQIQQQPRPIKPFRLENVINEEPYRLPNHPQPQQLLNPFSTPLISPATPTVPVTARPDLLGQTINQYELEQINNQFFPQPQTQPEFQTAQLEEETPNEYEQVVTQRQPPSRKSNRVSSTTPTLVSSRTQHVTDSPREIPTTTKPQLRSRGRPTQRTTVASTPSHTDKHKYTVLEEFSAKRRPIATTSRGNYIDSISVSSTPPPQEYTTNLRHEPTRVTQPAQAQPLSISPLGHQSQTLSQLKQQLDPQAQPQPQAVYTPASQQQQLLNQQILNQEVLDKQILQQPAHVTSIPTGPAGVQTFYQLDANGRFVPYQAVDNSYSLGNQQAFQQEVQAFRGTGPGSTTTPEAPQEIVTSTVKLTERPLEQSTRGNARGNTRSRTRGRTHYAPEAYQESGEVKNEDSSEDYKLPAELPSIHPGLHGLINDLQDQSLRPLLVPASIAPTTEHALRTQSSTRQQQQQVQEQPQQHFFLEQHPQYQQPQQQYVLQQQQEPQQQLILQQPQQEQQLILQSQQQQQPQLVLQPQHQQPPQQQYVIISSTEPEPQPLTTAPPPPVTYAVTTAPTVETTTANRRQRGRQRGRGSTTTSTPRRTAAQRTRKPTSRSRTEQTRYQQELEDYADYSPVKAVQTQTREIPSRHSAASFDYDTETSRKPASRQRSRTRGRPVQEVTLTERTSNSNSDEQVSFKQPPLQTGFQASNAQLLQPPQSYMQFEQPVVPIQQHEEGHLLNQYQQGYSIEEQPSISTESLPISSKQKLADRQQKLSVDVLINHPITEHISKTAEPVIISQPEQNVPYVRFNSNAEPSGRQHKQEVEETTKAQPRQRGRGRGRARTKPTTQRPASTTARRVSTTTEEAEEEEEFYGFIRPPNFNRPSGIQQRPKPSPEEPKLYSATYVSSTGQPLRDRAQLINYEDQPVEDSNNVQIYSSNTLTTTPRVQFLGKIRPKYPIHTTKTEEPIEVVSEPVTTEKRYHAIRTTKPTFSPKTRTRSRPRLPNRKTQNDPPRTFAKKTTPQPPRTEQPSTEKHRFKPRGISHFELPDNLKGSDKSEDEDVEGGNYPVPFLKGQEVQTERPKFQITIDPGLEENLSEEDQLPYSSIYSPKIVRGDQNPSEVNVVNDIPIERKVIESKESLEQPTALPVISTTEKSLEEKNDTEVEKVILEEILGDVQESNEEDDKFSEPKDYLELEEQAGLTTTTVKPKNRRRGMWRLVKRPLDSFETAESQYVGNVVANSFDNDKGKENVDSSKGHVETINNFNTDADKEQQTTTIDVTQENSQKTDVTSEAPEESSSSSEENFFDSLYKMFGMVEGNQSKQGTVESDEKTFSFTTEASSPLQSLEITTKSEDLVPVSIDLLVPVDQPQYVIALNDSLKISANNSFVDEEQIGEKQDHQTLTESPNLLIESLVASEEPQIIENLDPQESWDLGSIKTSTSTEISHETEICYRGRCVKSSGTKIPTL